MGILLTSSAGPLAVRLKARITNDDVKKLCIPVADWEVQEAIVRELARRRAEARQLKQQAEKEWTAAKERFEKELLEG